MTLGDEKGLSSDINVTPMIDVLLVLLVVFMLSVQVRQSLPVNLPLPAQASRPAPQSPHVVLELKSDGSYTINGAGVGIADLEARLRELTDGGRRQLLFVRAAPGRRYGEVIQAVDLARGVGWRVIGYMP